MMNPRIKPLSWLMVQDFSSTHGVPINDKPVIPQSEEEFPPHILCLKFHFFYWMRWIMKMRYTYLVTSTATSWWFGFFISGGLIFFCQRQKLLRVSFASFEIAKSTSSCSFSKYIILTTCKSMSKPMLGSRNNSDT